MARPLPRLAVAALVALAAAPARAGGLEQTALAPAAIGAGGALGGGDDLVTAATQQPALLALGAGGRAVAGVGFRTRQASFLRATGPEGSAPFPEVESRTGAAASPLVAVAVALGARLHLAVAYAEPGDHRIDLPLSTVPADQRPAELDPARYSAIEALRRRRAAILSGALRATTWLALGAAVTLSRVDLRLRRTWPAGLAPDAPDESPSADTVVDLHVADRLVPTFTASLLLRAPRLGGRLALSLETPAGVDGAGSAELVGPAGAAPVLAIDRAATAASLHSAQPLIARGGLRLERGRIAAEAGGAFERWGSASVVDAALSPAPLASAPPTARADVTLATAPVDLRLRDTFVAGGGLELEAVRGLLRLRGGYRFERAAVARAELSPALPELDRHVASVGLGAAVSGLRIDLAYAHTFARSAQVGAADSAQRSRPIYAERTAAPVAAGRYRGAEELIALAVEVRLPELRAAAGR